MGAYFVPKMRSIYTDNLSVLITLVYCLKGLKFLKFLLHSPTVFASCPVYKYYQVLITMHVQWDPLLKYTACLYFHFCWNSSKSRCNKNSVTVSQKNLVQKPGPQYALNK